MRNADSMRHRVYDDVRHELEGVGGIGCGIIRIIGPLEAIAEIFVPGHQYVDPPALIQDSEHLWNFSRRTVLPLLAIAALCDRVIGHLNDVFDVVKTMK